MRDEKRWSENDDFDDVEKLNGNILCISYIYKKWDMKHVVTLKDYDGTVTERINSFVYC